MKEIAVIQHVDWEGAGQFLLNAAKRCKVKLRIFQAWQNSFPDPLQFAGMIMLGGAPNVDQVEDFPFLSLEKQWLQEVLRVDKPCLGMCLGHQLLAEALGATIGKNFCNSVGMTTGLITSHGKVHPLLAGSPVTMPLFKWHGQSVQTPVPHHFEILMTSKECQVEAFSIKGRPHLVGIQFDNHAASFQDVAIWCEQEAAWLAGMGLTGQQVLQSVEQDQVRLEKDFSQLFGSFCTML